MNSNNERTLAVASLQVDEFKFIVDNKSNTIFVTWIEITNALLASRHLTHYLDDTTKVPSFKQCTSDAQGPPPPTPGHVSSGPIFCLHTRQISERQSKSQRYDTLLDWKQTLRLSRHLTHHPPTWTTLSRYQTSNNARRMPRVHHHQPLNM